MDSQVPKPLHNPKVDSEVLKMVLDVNSDILGSYQRLVIELFLDHSWVKRLLEPCMLPCSFFQDADLLPILKMLTFVFAYGQYCTRQMMEFIQCF